MDRLADLYNLFEAEAKTCLEQGLVVPAHDYIVRCSHTFNLLAARKAISVAERTRFIGRIRNIARKVAVKYTEQRKEMGYPLIKDKG